MNFEIAARAAYYNMLAIKAETGKETGVLLHDYNNVFNVRNIHIENEEGALVPFSSAFKSGNEWSEFLGHICDDGFDDMAGDYMLGIKTLSTTSSTGDLYAAVESDERFGTYYECQNDLLRSDKIDPLEFFYRCTHSGAEVLEKLQESKDISLEEILEKLQEGTDPSFAMKDFSLDVKIVDELFVFKTPNGFLDYDVSTLKINGITPLEYINQYSEYGSEHNNIAHCIVQMLIFFSKDYEKFQLIGRQLNGNENEVIEFADWVNLENVSDIVIGYQIAIQDTIVLKEALDKQELTLNVGRKFNGLTNS